jgi:hypothetical protein
MAKRGDFDMSAYKREHTVSLDRYGYAPPKRASGGRNKTRPTEENLAHPASANPIADAGHNIRTRRRSGGGSVSTNDDGTVDADSATLAQLQTLLEASQRDDQDPLEQSRQGLQQAEEWQTPGMLQNQFQRSRPGGIGRQIAEAQKQRPKINDIVDESMQDYDPDPDKNQQ